MKHHHTATAGSCTCGGGIGLWGLIGCVLVPLVQYSVVSSHYSCSTVLSATGRRACSLSNYRRNDPGTDLGTFRPGSQGLSYYRRNGPLRVRTRREVSLQDSRFGKFVMYCSNKQRLVCTKILSRRRQNSWEIAFRH